MFRFTHTVFSAMFVQGTVNGEVVTLSCSQTVFAPIDWFQ